MRLLLSAALLLTIPHGYLARTFCGDGWVSGDTDYCFQLQEQPETFELADQTCAMMGGSLAFGDTKAETDLLVKLVRNKPSVFGWWYGAVGSLTYAILRKDTGYYTNWKSVSSLPLPPFKQRKAPDSSKCIGITPMTAYHYSKVPQIVHMIDVPCHVHLPYVCRSDLPAEKTVGNFHLAQNGTDLYWFSSPTDRRSFQGAQKACSDKGMKLLAIRDRTQVEFIEGQIKARGLNNTNPWWIGLTVNHGVFNWNDPKMEMHTSVLNWKRESFSGSYFLTSDGTVDLVPAQYTDNEAPFICKRSSSVTGKLGCPANWTRGGQSCYVMPSKIGIGYRKAEKLCKKFDAHVLSVDTKVEKLWILGAMEKRIHYNIWTSLTKTHTPGKYVWGDGSPALPGVVTWSSLTGNGIHVAYHPFSNSLQIKDATQDWAIPGCQFSAPDGNCYSTNWKLFNGNCYFVPQKTGYSYRWRAPYSSMLHQCYVDLANYTDTVNIMPLKIDSKQVGKLFNTTGLQNHHIWTGMTRKKLWADGSSVDMSLFKLTHEGLGNCIFMKKDGTFYKEMCGPRYTAQTVCEKELPNGGAAVVTSHFGAHVLLMLCACFSVMRFI